MSDSPRDAATARWDAYWRHGFLTSCADTFAGNYGGSIASFWAEVFATRRGDCTVLDVCTGNGAVAALAADDARTRGLDWTLFGIDIADIRPAEALADRPELLQAIRFYPRTSADDLPFDDASVDLACGQYALEYAPLPGSVRELARVLRPGGEAVFVLHHSDSVILRTTREELAHRERLSADDELFAATHALAARVAAAGSAGARRALATDAGAEALRHRLNAAAARISAAADASPHPEILLTALGYAGKAFAAAAGEGLAATEALLEQGRAEIAANFARLDDLSAAALDRTAMAALCELFEQAGFASPVRGRLDHDKSLIGWTLRAIRQA